MSSVGRNIETAIQSMLKVSEDVADLQAKLDNAMKDLNMLETLFSVSKYIGLNPEQHIIMSVLEDSIKGVFGASYCQVIFDKDKTHMSNSKELYNHLSFNTLQHSVSDILIIDDVSTSELTDLEQGSLIIVKLAVGDELYGFLSCYWTISHNLNESSILFLQIISSQVSMFLKSNSLIEEFKALAVNDPLTGIYNRSYFQSIEENTIPMLGDSIIIFDIDHFKKINDTKGHQYGDKILIKFAAILTEIAAKYRGTAFKYGGEEFIIKCSDGESIAMKIAEEVRLTFQKETGYTVSLGIGTLGTSSRVASYERLLSQADSALYVSKQTGRNKSTVATGDIQVLRESGDALTKTLSKSYRKISHSTIFRIITRDYIVISEEKFHKLHQTIKSLGRLYDELYLTDSLDIMVIVDGEIDEELFLSRIQEKLKLDFPEIHFIIYPLKDIYNEVILHSSRVSELSQIIAGSLGLKKEQINKIQLAAEWHDLGKLCTDPEIYSKKGKLTDPEFEVIKMHTWLSFLIASNHPSMSDFAHWILYHHENFDGTGYYKVNGIDIPYEAQIIGLVDKFDALTEKRCYRPAYHWKEAMAILNDEEDKFDPKLLTEFKYFVSNLMEE